MIWRSTNTSTGWRAGFRSRADIPPRRPAWPAEQISRPWEVYEHCTSTFAAGFVGVSNMLGHATFCVVVVYNEESAEDLIHGIVQFTLDRKLAVAASSVGVRILEVEP